MSKISEWLRLTILLPLAERVSGTCTSYWLKQIEEMNTWLREDVIAWQEQKLQDFVRHAYEHTMYYRKLFDSLGLRPEDIQHAEDLKKLPVLTKDTIRARYDEFIPDDIDSIPHRLSKTGGTTGEPMGYLTDENTWGYITASKVYSWKKIGYRYGDKFAALGSSSLFQKKASVKRRLYDWLRQEKGFNCLNLSEDLCEEYIRRMRKVRIHYIYGYASSVYLLAKYARDHQEDVSFVKGVFTTSENLTPYYREIIESTFQCKVMDSYGARDAGITAFELSPEKYPVSYSVIPEIAGESGAEAEGTLLTTCFLNNAFPLMRYDFGDSVRINYSDPDYNGAVITRVNGRTSDVIQLDNGHILTSPGFTILMNHFDVLAYQIKQVDGKSVLLSIQRDTLKWSYEQENRLKKEMQRYLGDGCTLELEYVDQFIPLKNGKRGFFFNK